MRPAECVAHLDEIEERARLKIFTTDDIKPAYHSTALRGRAQFDYSNNDGRFSLGEGHFYLETCWSKASDRSIHAYNDPQSIKAIALAKGARSIAEISDAFSYDFTSRTRTPSLGEVVVWCNANGIFAATQVAGIADVTRGAEHDELVFDYVILVGGVDFRSNST